MAWMKNSIEPSAPVTPDSHVSTTRHGPEATDFATGVHEGDGLVTVSYNLPAPPPPDNDFSLGKLKRNTKTGTAKLRVNVPGPGELDLAKTNGVKALQETADAAREQTLIVKARGGAKKKLNADGKAKVDPKVTYTPEGGEPNTERKRIKLIKG